MKRTLILIVLIAICLAAATMNAEILRGINYQGVLTDAGGMAVPDGWYDLTFRLYTDMSGGTPIWESAMPVQVVKGVFNAVLGEYAALTPDFADIYYLGISVEEEAELTPRVLLVPSPYAMASRSLYGAHNRIPSVGNAGIGTDTPVERLEVNGGVKLGYTDTENAGTIRWDGYDFEGYDGSMWRTLTATGADVLPPGTEGAVLFHNGSEWAPSWAIYLDNSVGMGTTDPQADLHILGSTDQELRIEADDSTLSAMVRLEATGANNFSMLRKDGPYATGTVAGVDLADLTRLTTSSQAGAIMLQTQSPSPIHFVTGDQERMRIDGEGDVEIYGSGGRLVEMTEDVDGGRISLYDTDNSAIIDLEPSVSGVGGELWLRRNATGTTGILCSGSYNTGEPFFLMHGEADYVAFNLHYTGDSTVELPVNSISSAEILDEPGVASYDGGSSMLALGTDPHVLGSSTITAPAAGYVLVLGTAQIGIAHVFETTSSAEFGVSESPAGVSSNRSISTRLAGSCDTGLFDIPVTAQNIFPVESAGAYTYYFLGERKSGDDIYVFDIQLSVVFIPTAYGAVASAGAGIIAAGTAGSERTALTASEIATERAASIAANDARVESELSAMRERMEALERELRKRQD